MEGIVKPRTDRYKEITNYWNYDASSTLTSLPVWDLEHFKRSILVAQSVRGYELSSGTLVTACKTRQLLGGTTLQTSSKHSFIPSQLFSAYVSWQFELERTVNKVN
jgi:hypothetical protein